MPRKNITDLDCERMRELFALDTVESFCKALQRKFPFQENIVPRTREELPFHGAFGGSLIRPNDVEWTDEKIIELNKSRILEWKELAAKATYCCMDCTIGGFAVVSELLAINMDVGLKFLIFARNRYNRCSAAEKGMLLDAQMRTRENQLGEEQYKRTGGRGPIPRDALLRKLKETPPTDAELYNNDNNKKINDFGQSLKALSIREYETVSNKYHKLGAKYLKVGKMGNNRSCSADMQPPSKS